MRETKSPYLITSEDDALEKLPNLLPAIIHMKASFPVSQKFTRVLHSFQSTGMCKSHFVKSATRRRCSLDEASTWVPDDTSALVSSQLPIPLHNCGRKKGFDDPLQRRP